MNPESGDNKNDVLLDLNFVPNWARKPPEASPYADTTREDGGYSRSHHRDERRDGRDRERNERFRRREGKDRTERDMPRAPRPAMAGEGQAPERATSGDWDRGGATRGPRQEALPPPFPVEVTFVPERAGLITIARRIAKVGRAFSLFDVASLFLSQPDYFTLKLSGQDVQPADGAPAPADPEAAPVLEKTILYQCRECKQIFSDRAQAAGHAMARHLEQFYKREEQVVEPPQGAFTSVARCGLSGELLGPPNHHSFNDRLLELHRTRYSHLALDDYRRRIENVHDAALLEQWKEQMKKRTVYNVIGKPETPPLQSFAEVEKHFSEHLAADMVKEGGSFTIAGPVSRELEDRRLRRAVMDAWHRENRFPLRLSITLRLAFRHLGLHTFKTAAGGNFVTAIVPSVLDPETAIPLIKEILQVLEQNPGTEKAKLLETLRPGAVPESPEAHELISQLRWLVDKGHVIEFSDGRLAVPRSAVRKVQQAKREERRHGGRPGRQEAESA
ncbi:MAG: hypothetical protein R6X19_07995 [Kiritimatiellia bacterium]